MAEPRIYGGYEYTQQPDGSWRRGRAVGQQGIQVQPGNPYAEPKARAEVANTLGTIEERRAASERAERKLAIEARRLQLEEEKAAQEAEERALKNSGRETNKSERVSRIETALENIENLRKMVKSSGMSTGGIVGQETFRSGDDFLGASSWFNQQANDVAGAIQMIEGDLINQVRKEMEESGSPIGVKGADTEKEAQRLAASIANLAQTQDEEQFLIGLKRAEDYYKRRLDGLGGGEQAGERRAPPRIDPMAPGFADADSGEKSIPIPQAMQQEHAVYLQQNWGRIEPDAYAQFRAGLDRKYGFEPRPDAYRNIVPGLNGRAQQGGSPDGLNIPPVSAKMDGLDQVNASLFNNSAGGFMFGMGDQLGIADEMAGGFNSLVNGTSYDVEVARADAMKQAMQQAYSGENLAGNLTGAVLSGGAIAKAFPKAAQMLAANGKRAVASGSGFGAISGAGEFNDNRVAGGAMGLGLGAAGGVAGVAVSPLIRKAMETGPGLAASKAARGAWNSTAGRVPGLPTVAAAPTVPRFNKGEGLLPAEVLENAIPNLQDADSLGLPYALADADPKLRALAGSVSRRSADARQMAENVFEPRARGQADRLVNAIDTRLAPITDIRARASELLKAGSTAADPYYTRAYAQGALDDPVVSSILGTPSGQDAIKRAYRIAADERRDPTAMGFIFDEGTGGVKLNQGGRFSAERPPEPRHERAVIQGRGRRAPADLVTFVRQNGGLRDQSGELSHFGATNKGRRGVPFAGQDTKWGPLVRDDGRNIDDMAEQAWEAGYFGPTESTERPTTREFLEILRETHDGVNRRFHPADEDIVKDYFAAQSDRYAWHNMDGKVRDISEPAGPREAAPPEAYGREVGIPTYQTLHMVKRGFDDAVEDYRDDFGKLNLAGKPVAQGVNRLRGELNERLGQINTDYAKGNEVYSGFAKRRDALGQGFNLLPRNNVPLRDFDETLGRARTYDNDFRQNEDRLIPEMQRGYATNMADTADKMRYSANPYEAVFGSPLQQRKVASLFPEGAGDFARTYGLERDMSKTAYETLGGSPTAARQAADGQFDSGLMGMGGDLAADAMGGGGMFTARNVFARAARALGDSARLRGGKSKADAIAPVLFEPDPRVTLDYLADLQARQAQAATRNQGYRARTGLFGSVLPSAFFGAE